MTMSKLLHTLFFSLIIPSFLFYIFMPVEANYTTYPHCPSHNCSNLIIKYPFYKFDNESTIQNCGYQGFGINCSINGGSEYPIIYIGQGSYFVQNIFYENASITLVDYDVFSVVPDPAPSYCPRVQHSIHLETLPLNFSTSTLNLSFHFNCSGSPLYGTEIPCLRYPEENRSSFVNMLYSDMETDDWAVHSCKDQVVTTVFRDQIRWNGINLLADYGKALSRGFELVWERGDPKECYQCEMSYGVCGRLDTTEFLCFCPDGKTSKDICEGIKDRTLRLRILIGSLLVTLSIMFCIIICCLTKFSPSECVHSYKPKTEEYKNIEAFITQYRSLSTKRYKYVDIKKMTNSFEVKLGKGGFGTVFKGKLSDGRLVAVKVLNSSKASGQEFINEVASIGRTSHVNIITLLGFCFDYKKRALVYEFMPNGSLEKFIHSHDPLKTSEYIGVEQLYHIALGIAQGLDYLHRGCITRILHLDIKPHNILLDEDFCPKLADFGLAKLYSRKESIVSMLNVRGTIGYIAPEVLNRNFGGVSHKSDVYSYGMLILEMVGGRKNIDAGVGSGRTSEIYFPYWIYSRLEKEGYLLDDISTAEENDYARKMTIVGLWCIQTHPTQRPSIGQVIEMLEGSMEALEVPPNPIFSSPLRSPATAFSTSQDEPEINVVED